MTKAKEKKRKHFRIPSAIWIPIALVVGIAILVFGIPIAINEAYKCKFGYVTLWGANDVLSYYGAILGSIIAVATLSITIVFTRKQIMAENQRKAELEKWERVEAVFQKALTDINPQQMVSIIIQNTSNITTQQYYPTISALQFYIYTSKTSLDTLKCFVNPEEYKTVEPLTAKIIEAIECFCKLGMEYIDHFGKVQANFTMSQVIYKSNTIKPGKLDTEDFNAISQKVIEASNTIYQPLLDMKREVFSQIYKQIETRTSRILYFGRK